MNDFNGYAIVSTMGGFKNRFDVTYPTKFIEYRDNLEKYLRDAGFQYQTYSGMNYGWFIGDDQERLDLFVRALQSYAKQNGLNLYQYEAHKRMGFVLSARDLMREDHYHRQKYYFPIVKQL